MLNEVHDLNSHYENTLETEGISENEEDKVIIKDAYHSNSFLLLQFSILKFFVNFFFR